jgi:HEAT repeat protein
MQRNEARKVDMECWKLCGHANRTEDLQHPNEFVRGNTLRFVNKLSDPELIEPLLAPVSTRTSLAGYKGYRC